MLEADYRKKTQELSAEKATLKEVVEIIDFLKKNPKKAEKVMAILEEKEEKLEQQKQALEEKEDEIDKALKDLPEDDPYAKLLRGMKAQLQTTLKPTKRFRINSASSNRTSRQRHKDGPKKPTTPTGTRNSRQANKSWKRHLPARRKHSSLTTRTKRPSGARE
jgi:ABC-type nitrate/sulfonate/bicarbonate transport system substrate-binding protein